MVRTYLTSLVQSIPLHDGKHDGKGVWNPQISITVMAVYPGGMTSAVVKEGQRVTNKVPFTSLLVRYYQLIDKAAAERLVQHLETWLYPTVEEAYKSTSSLFSV